MPVSTRYSQWTNPAMTQRGTWETAAACADDPDLMYAERNTKKIKAAQAVCAGCPVRDACLASAMAEEADDEAYRRHGIRGGLTSRQRYRLHQRQQQAEDAT